MLELLCCGRVGILLETITVLCVCVITWKSCYDLRFELPLDWCVYVCLCVCERGGGEGGRKRKYIQGIEREVRPV